MEKQKLIEKRAVTLMQHQTNEQNFQQVIQQCNATLAEGRGRIALLDELIAECEAEPVVDGEVIEEAATTEAEETAH